VTSSVTAGLPLNSASIRSSAWVVFSFDFTSRRRPSGGPRSRRRGDPAS
jgi:hypothetical protein